MAARSKARKRALDLLFEADQRRVNAGALLADRQDNPGDQPPLNPYTVVAHWAEIDELLTTYSHGWTLPRMPGVDRSILRLGAWEVVWNDQVPDGVAISEAVELARTLSTDDSPSFVNGLLARLAEVKPTLV